MEQVEELNDRFTCAVNQLREADSRMPGVSLGYGYYDAAASHIHDVIAEADAMLYRNKKHGQ